MLSQGDGTVQRIDGKTGELLATIDTGLSGNDGQIASGGGYVWVTIPGTPVGQIDPKTNTLVHAFEGGDMGDAICYGAGSLWVSGSTIIAHTDSRKPTFSHLRGVWKVIIGQHCNFSSCQQA